MNNGWILLIAILVFLLYLVVDTYVRIKISEFNKFFNAVKRRMSKLEKLRRTGTNGKNRKNKLR